MRLLSRALAATPTCLTSYQHGRHTWDDVTGAHKEQISISLEQMQGRRCAYCEGPLNALGRHIEHFRRKRHFVHLTFDWSNLFWSCDQSDSCGHYKDARGGPGPYNPDDLLDPCLDDPSRFFKFRSDGTIQVRGTLSKRDDFRARETLRVLNLHPEFGRLRNMRKATASAYLQLVSDLADFDASKRSEYARDEIAKTAAEPFSQLIRQMFEDLV